MCGGAWRPAAEPVTVRLRMVHRHVHGAYEVLTRSPVRYNFNEIMFIEYSSRSTTGSSDTSDPKAQARGEWYADTLELGD
jgi:hypothetical protein